MSTQPPDKILEKSAYLPLLENIEAYNQKSTLNEDDYQQHLNQYIDFLQLRDSGYPLLLRNGQSLSLGLQPLTTHLLPPIESVQERWLLVTFLTENSELLAQIIQWTINDHDHDHDQSASIQSLADPVPVVTEPALARNGRFYSLNFIETNGQCLITLTFQEGILNVITNHQTGIISTAWTKKTTQSPVTERCSWGSMDEAIKIRRNPDGVWQDDSILDKEGNELGKNTFKYGWIRGADSPQDNPDIVYMATNQANVICIDKTAAAKLVWKSPPLEGKALDALIAQIPGRGGHAVLASTDNGMVYLLIPEPEEPFKKKYVQLAGPRIERCIGFGTEHILILDSRNLLSPLQLTNPEQFWDQRDQATQKLASYYFKDITQSSFHNADLNRLLLEYYLYSLADNTFDNNILTLFEQLCNDLNNAIDAAINDNNQKKLLKFAELKYVLIRRFFQWLKRSTTHQQLKEALSEKDQSLNLIWELVKPNHGLPDYVCLSLLRESGWLRRWAIKQAVLPDNKQFAEKLTGWQNDLQTLRKTFATGLEAARSLNTLNHYQLNSHCDHIEILDEEKGIFAVLEYTGDLLIFKISETQWQVIDKFSSDAGSRQNLAQLSFIHALPNLGGGNFSRDKIHLITGSSRGEISLFCFNQLTETLALIHHVECKAHLVCCLNIPGQQGVLLGGYCPDEKAVLYRWSYSRIRDKDAPRLLWSDSDSQNGSQSTATNAISSIRQLRLSQNGQRLWAMNRETGCLYRWDIAPGLFVNKKYRLPEPQSVLRTTRHLYALDYSSDHNLLVCGGVGGMAYAFDAKNGSCYWTVICSGNLRRVVFLPDYPVSDQATGAWLLCGDDQSSLIVDQDGNVAGIIKKAGPICASASYQNSNRVVLCTLDGRLMLMDYSSTKNNQLESNSLYSPISHPVRNRSLIGSAEMMKQLLNINRHDSHSNMAVLHKFSIYLGQHNIDADLQKQFLEYWQHQSLERQILFLYWLRSSCLENRLSADNKRGFVLTIIQTAWEDFNTTSNVGLSCKLVSPLFDLLNNLESTEHQTQDLLTTITATIWTKQPDNKVTDSSNALAAIRWNQSAKCWKQAIREANNGDINLNLLFNWCNLIARECNANNDEELRRSLSLLANLHLYNPPKDHAPSQWFMQFFTVEHTKPVETTLAFHTLLQPIDKPLSDQQLDALKKLLPDNAVWITWLEWLQEILVLLNAKRKNNPHIAWQEQESWQMLLDHLVSEGQRRFSVLNQQAMLALWWPQLVDCWERFIQGERQNLDQSVRLRSNKYLHYICEDHWQNNHAVTLELTLYNRFPEELRLENITVKPDNGTDTSIQETPQFPVALPASDKNTVISVRLNTDKPDQLECVLQLQCSMPGSVQSLIIELPIHEDRNLLRLSEQPDWKPTWDRLADLLTEFSDNNKPFYWIDGNIWPDADRTHLWDDLLAKYQPDQITTSRLIPLEVLSAGIDLPVFSPDLALGAAPEILLEQFHSLLNPIVKDDFTDWALAIWREGKELPTQIKKTFHTLPNQQVVLALLDNLMGETNRIQLLQCLQKLPQSAFGSWCSNDPFYTPKDDTVDSTDLYPASSALLPMSFWEIIDEANIPDSELADLLAITSDQAKVDKHNRQLFYQAITPLFDNLGQKLDAHLCEPVMLKLLSRLGATGINAESAMWWSTLIISLNWQDFDVCYLLPKCSANTRRQMREIANKQHATKQVLWLCLGETEPPEDLQGEDLQGLVIVINPEETLALMHVIKPAEAAQLLNQIATRVYGADADKAFTTAGGLGSMVEKHFGGREQELKKLWACLDEADKNGAGALIVGGRRIGKTALRERIRFDIDKKQPRRVYLEFNFEKFGEDQERQGIKLEFWFFKRMQELFAKTTYPFDDKWLGSYDTNVGKRDQARVLLQDHLDKIKQNTGYAPLFIFDETENLVRWDTASGKDCWSLFKLFRSLLQEGKLCLFATSYPHGLDSRDSLNIANLSAGSPIHNTFSDSYRIKLGVWKPKTTWEYLSSRLAGLGVVLPRHYRNQILEISCGIPWIVHAIGLHVCDHLPKGEKVVYSQIWDKAKAKVLEDIHDNLKVSVTNVANDLDLKHQVLDTKKKLGDGKLWNAFKTVANNRVTVLSPDGNDWLPPVQFNREQLQGKLPDVPLNILREALRRLSSSPVIEGIASSENQFIFSHNLFPSWLQHTQG